MPLLPILACAVVLFDMCVLGLGLGAVALFDMCVLHGVRWYGSCHQKDLRPAPVILTLTRTLTLRLTLALTLTLALALALYP